MKKILIFSVLFSLAFFLNPDELKYPFLYIPGMFDNGDLFTKDYQMADTLNGENGFYYKNYFIKKYNYDKDELLCGSNITGVKFNRLIVANLIGEYRKNIPLELMSERLFTLMQGKAPKQRNFKALTGYKGNDYSGFIIKNESKIYFYGIIEELWAKYGKKVYYKKFNDGYRVILDEKKESVLLWYENSKYYFENITEIKINVIVHSSGGLAIRRYLALCEEYSLPHHINLIVNLSVPQKGAKINYKLKNAFTRLIGYAVESFFENKDTGYVVADDTKDIITYKRLIEKTGIDLLYGDSMLSKSLKNIIGLSILYLVPFDGRSGFLGSDPALYDLHPAHGFIKKLNNSLIDKKINIYNFRVISPRSKMFELIASFSMLGKSDGIVSYDETGLEHLQDGSRLNIKNIDVEKANHIPLPYIKPLFELKESINEYYPFLKILLKKKENDKEGKKIIYALVKALMNEFGFDLKNFLLDENYSVIDYFAENPAVF